MIYYKMKWKNIQYNRGKTQLLFTKRIHKNILYKKIKKIKYT